MIRLVDARTWFFNGFLLLLGTTLLTCQSGSIKKGETATAVAPVQLNMLYTEIENPVDIAVSTVSPGDLQVGITEGSIKKGNQPGRYVIHDVGVGTTRVILQVSKGKQLDTIAQRTFVVKRLPDPEAKVGPFASGIVSIEDFQKQDRLHAVLEGIPFEVDMKILNYKLTYIQKRGEAIIMQNEGPQFNEEASELIDKAQTGDRIFIDQIKVKGPGGERKLPAISFELR